MSYVLRCASKNRLSVPQLFRKIGLRWVGSIREEHVEQLGRTTLAGCDWFRNRVATPDDSGRWQCFWAGRQWRTPGLFYRPGCQICAPCLHKTGIARQEWDLAMFCACPIHGKALTGTCPRCNMPYCASRPCVDVCTCKRHVRSRGDEVVASAQARELMLWVSASLHDPLGRVALPDWLGRIIPGQPSIDGLWRCIRAFGLRPEAEPTIQSSEAEAKGRDELTILGRGLARLARLDSDNFDPTAIHAESLRLQCLRGVTATDRSIARHLMKRAGLTVARVWPKAGLQMELFE